MNYSDIQKRFDYYVAHAAGWNTKQKGAIIGILNTACGSDENRKWLLKQLTGYSSSKDLSDAQWYALFQFVKPSTDGGIWHSVTPNFEHLCQIVIAEACKSPLQENMFIPDDVSPEG